MLIRLTTSFLLLFCATSILAGPPIAIDTIQRAEPVSFEREILPVLQKNCLACHSATAKQGGLILESPKSMFKGGESGAAIVAGNGAESLLIKLASHQTEPVMPPEGNDVAARNLTSRELGLIRLWIDQGALGTSSIDSMSPKQLLPLSKEIAAVQGIALTPDGQFVAFSRGSRILLHHVPTGQLITELSDPALSGSSGAAHLDLVQALAFNVDGDLLASGGFREAKLWRRPRDVQQMKITTDGSPSTLAVSPDQKWIATNSAENTVRLFQVPNGTPGLTLSGHADVVTAIRFTADGQWLLTASLDKTVRLFDLQAGVQIGVLETPASVTALELVLTELPTGEKPDVEQWIVTGHSDNKIRVWQMPSNTAPQDPAADSPPTETSSPETQSPDAPANTPAVMPLKEISGHSGAITALTSIPQLPRQVMSASMDSTVRRWNLDSGQQLQQYNHGGSVTAIAVAPDGQRIASTSDNHTARLFNINGQQIAEMRGDIRRRVALTRAQQLESAINLRLNLARRQAEAAEKDLPVKTAAEKTLSDMLTAATSDVQKKKSAVETTFTEKTVTEKAAIDASGAAKVALVEKQRSEQLAKEAATSFVLGQAKLNRLTQASKSAPQNEELKQKLAAAQEELAVLSAKSTQLAAAVQAPSDKASEMSNIANEAAKKLDAAQKPYNDAVDALKVAESAQNLLAQQQAIAAKERLIAMELVPIRMDVVAATEALLTESRANVEAANKSLQESDLPIRTVCFSPDGSVLATGGDFPGIHTWDAKTGAAIGAFVGHTSTVRSAVFITEKNLASTSDDMTIRLWDANPSWILERTIGSVSDPRIIPHRVTSVDFNSDSSHLLLAGGIPSRRGELQVFNVTDGSRVLYLPQAHDDVVYSARFSPEGKRIASGGADKYVRTFDLANSQQLRRLEGHTGYVLGVTWKRDGNVLVSGGADNTIKVWDAETGDQQRTIENFNRHVTAVQYIGETDNVISACGDKIVRMHNAGNGGLARTFNNSRVWLHCIAATPDNNVVAAGDAAGNVYLWNGNNGQQLKVFSLPTAETR